MKELGTFGAIISFALDLEQQVLTFYEELSDEDLMHSGDQLLKSSQKRLGRLKRIRQELVTEMILEPITGIKMESYHYNIGDSQGKNQFIQQALKLEENLGNFYSDAAPLIPMKEVERAFLRLAMDNAKRKAQLEKLI